MASFTYKWSAGIVVAAVLHLSATTSLAMGESIDFETDIRPLLERSCFSCHGPERQKSGYRLDVRSIALKGGDHATPAILPHDSANSPLIAYISSPDPDHKMPPPKSDALAMSEEEITLLRAWIDEGPQWPDALAGDVAEEAPHWSLEPLVMPEVPPGASNPIDAFIQERLRAVGLAPSPASDRRTLIQRLYFDLIGLPPSPEEVEAFCADTTPNAFEPIVDRLLASPRYGERWARHWLDTIQFADTHGYEHDIGRENAWPFRDYVIQALNDDRPWARFIREQLATDYFYPEQPERTPALGYLGAGPFDFSTYLTAGVTFDYLARDTLVTQTTAAFISTTASCARCHHHKFDPIPQADYYALQAVFAGVLKGDLAYDTDVATQRRRSHWEGVMAAITAGDGAALLNPENENAMTKWLAARGDGATWTPLRLATYLSLEGATLTEKESGIVVAGGARPAKDTYVLTGTSDLSEITALRLDVVADEALPMGGPGRQENGNFHLSEIEMRVFNPGAETPVVVSFARATADFNQADWGSDNAIDGNGATAWGIHPAVGQAHHAVFELKEPMTIGAETSIAISLVQQHGDSHTIGAFRISLTGDAPVKALALADAATSALAVVPEERRVEQREALALGVMPYVAAEAIKDLPAPAMVYTAAASVDIPDGTDAPKLASVALPKPVHRMERGNFDTPAEEVGPGALSALGSLPARFALDDPNNEASRRAALADWIASPENVLTWRSIVNRVWHYHFGRGLCDTPSDLGRMGGTPSHPELIDWLALWFRDEAQGSLKALHRLIVTSDTYRQSSAYRDDGAALDGDNRLLWRQNVHRLDADAYRDYTIAVAGKLDVTMGGPGVQHFSQGPGPQLTPTLDYKAYDWASSGAGRRSIYSYIWRGIADPFMEALDFPDLGLLSPTRGFSVSSLQALALYNNDFVLYHSKALAERLAGEEPELAGQISRATQLLWYREPSAEEQIGLRAYADENGLAALCRVMLNSNEYLFVD